MSNCLRGQTQSSSHSRRPSSGPYYGTVLSVRPSVHIISLSGSEVQNGMFVETSTSSHVQFRTDRSEIKIRRNQWNFESKAAHCFTIKPNTDDRFLFVGRRCRPTKVDQENSAYFSIQTINFYRSTFVSTCSRRCRIRQFLFLSFLSLFL